LIHSLSLLDAYTYLCTGVVGLKKLAEQKVTIIFQQITANLQRGAQNLNFAPKLTQKCSYTQIFAF